MQAVNRGCASERTAFEVIIRTIALDLGLGFVYIGRIIESCQILGFKSSIANERKDLSAILLVASVPFVASCTLAY